MVRWQSSLMHWVANSADESLIGSNPTLTAIYACRLIGRTSGFGPGNRGSSPFVHTMWYNTKALN